MNKEELANAVYDVAHLTGNFVLRSGQTSTEYFDKYRFESQPDLLKSIAKHLKEFVPNDTEVLAGLEMGGIPIATALSFETGLPCAFIRKEAKEYGTCQFAEGLVVKGRNLCLIEDVITTGGQVALSTHDLRTEGALVNHALCVIYRGPKNCKSLKEANIELNSLFKMGSGKLDIY